MNRIEYLDSLKGICILLIVVAHCGVVLPAAAAIYAMPCFFIIGGFFYKDGQGGIKQFLIHKVNRILIPFAFFYLTAYVVFYGLKWFYPSLLVTGAEGITDVFCNRQLFNGPIWFLCCLFWNHLIFYSIRHCVNHWGIRVLISVVIGCVGYLMGQSNMFVPAFFDVAMSTMPYFAFGYYLKKSNFLNGMVSNSYSVILFIALYALSSFLLSIIPCRIGFRDNLLEGGGAMYVVTTLGSVSMMYLCKSFVHLPILSWIGKYSLLLLCLHHMVYRPVMVLFPGRSIIVAGGTVAICCVLIPPMVRFLPWFTGHANLIKER